MKKSIIVFTLAALAFTTTTAFAKDKGENNGNKNNRDSRLGIYKIEKPFDKQSKFVATGTVVSTTSNSVTLNVKRSVHVSGIVNNQVTISVPSTVKITKEKNQTITLADVKAGDQVVISGTVSGTTLTATKIHVTAPHGKAFGEVTATTSNSITIKNNSTGVSQTFTTNGETKVSVNGETKTIADVKAGDKGFVKFKTQASVLVAKFIALFR